jgi:predicted HicB family RNase H-like nuclease
MTTTQTPNTTFRLNPEMKKRAQIHALNNEISLTRLINDAVEQYLNNH